MTLIPNLTYTTLRLVSMEHLRQQRLRGYSNAAVRVWLGELVGECVRPSVEPLVNTIQT